MRKASPTLSGNEEGGVFLMTSSIAGIGPTGSTMAYSVSKAAGVLPTKERKTMYSGLRTSLDEMSCLNKSP